MADTILPFSLDRSTEKLTDRGSLATVDAYAEADWSARKGRPEISGVGFKPIGWKRRTIQVIRREALRLVGKVTKSARQLALQVRASPFSDRASPGGAAPDLPVGLTGAGPAGTWRKAKAERGRSASSADATGASKRKSGLIVGFGREAQVRTCSFKGQSGEPEGDKTATAGPHA